MTDTGDRAGWLLPMGASRPPALLPLGTLGRGVGAVVDGRGLITPGGPDGAWSLDWWIAAEDRWHVPAQEAATRQALVDDSPVVETRVRVPGGDAVQRAYAYVDVDGSDVVAVEIANESAVPIAVAMAIRPFGPTGTGIVRQVGLDALSTTVSVDGRDVLSLPRRPAGVAWSTGAGDVMRTVTADEAAAPAPPPPGHRSDRGQANAAFVFPVPHRQSVHFVVAVAGAVAARTGVAAPTAQQVANGWAAQTDRGARVELPEPAAVTALSVARKRLLLWDVDAQLAPALDQLGLHDDVEPLLGALALPDAVFGPEQPPAPYLVALGTHLRLTGNAALVAASADSIAAATRALALPPRRLREKLRSPSMAPHESTDATTSAAFASARDLFAQLGDRRAAQDCDRLSRVAEPAAVEPFAVLLSASAGAPGAPATDVKSMREHVVDLVSAVRQVVVDDTAAGRLGVLPGWTTAWYGQGIEVHDLPTAAGLLSYAVRWHGTRPALLWELVARTDRPWTLVAPELDPTWSSTKLRGDALLAAIAPPEAAPADSAKEPGGLPTSAQPPVSVWSIGPVFEPAEPPEGTAPKQGGESFS